MEEHPRQSRFSAGLLLLSVIPFALALCLTSSIPVGRVAKGAVERPALAFMQYSVNLGKVNSTGTIPGYFDFWNRGDYPLEIAEIKPSCGCLGPKLAEDKHLYAPGERGRIYVSVATANEESGEKHYTLDIQYRNLGGQKLLPRSSRQRSTQSSTESVAFLLTIPERKVTVTPSEVYFYQLNGKADHREIVVADHRGSKLEILDASITSEYASITVGEPHQTERGVWETPVRIDVVGEIPSGRKIAVATLLTSDPDFERIRIPVLIEGKLSKIQLTGGEKESGKPKPGDTNSE